MKTLLAIFFLFIAIQSRASEKYVYGTNLTLSGQSGFTAYSGPDAVEYFPSWLVVLNPGTNYVEGLIDYPLGTGVQKFYIQTIEYQDVPTNIIVSLPDYGGVSVTNNVEDLYTGLWSTPCQFTNSVATNKLRIRFTRQADISVQTKSLLFGVYTTTNLTSTVDRYGYLVDWTYPTNDTSTPTIAGNLLHDSSFETFGTSGWGFEEYNRTFRFYDCFATNVYRSGASSLFIPGLDSTGVQAQSRVYRVRPNLLHSISVWARSDTGTNTAVIGIQNVTVPPSGVGLSNQQVLTFSQRIGTNWTRLSTNAYLRDYPSPEFKLTLQSKIATGDTGTGVYFDDMQLEEGAVTTYSAASPLELGLWTPNYGNVFTNTPDVKCTVVNHQITTSGGLIYWEIYDNRVRLVASGSTNIAVESTATFTIAPSGHPYGWFRAVAWIDGVAGSEDEMQYIVLPSATSSDLVGVHTEGLGVTTKTAAALGAKWNRGLSSFKIGRWEVVQPTNTSLPTYYDSEITNNLSAGLLVLGNIGENAPTWAKRWYWPVGSVTGSGFVAGETLQSATGTGVVTHAMVATNYTGPALLISNVIGSFSSSASATGLTSGTKATGLTNALWGASDIPLWRTYVSNLVYHYGTNVPAWEIWNEPDQDGISGNVEIPSMAFYAELVREAANIVKGYSTNLQVVALGGMSSWSTINSVLANFDATTLGKIDLVSLHLYAETYRLSDNICSNVFAFYGKRAINSETGVKDRGALLGVNSMLRDQGLPVFPFSESKWLYEAATEAPILAAQNFIGSIGGGCRRYFIYDARQGGHLPSILATVYSVVDIDDGIIVRGATWSGIAKILGACVGAGQSAVAAGFEAYGFTIGTNAAVGIWTTNDTLTTVTLSGLTAGNVAQYDMFGNLVTNGTLALAVDRYPSLIVVTNTTATNLMSKIATASIVTNSDLTPPSISITYGPRTAIPSGTSASFRWFSTDNNDVPVAIAGDRIRYSYRLAGRDVTFSEWVADPALVFSGLPDGPYRLDIRSTDSRGNISATTERVFRVGSGSNELPPRLRANTINVGTLTIP